MECLLASRCSSSSPRKSRSIKMQWSSKRYSEERYAESPTDWPAEASQYELLEFAGKGAHAVVYKGRCKATGQIVAIKRLDLDLSWDMSALVSEATFMRKFSHPAVLPLHAAFVSGKELWFITPYMGLGSVRSIMKQHFPLGLDEVVIATIMYPVLEALEYVHRNGGIHRDVKADNILVSEAGDVVLADFGVAAARMRPVSMVNLEEQAGRVKTFVGTPCWMAPEVMQQSDLGYTTSADIWSFGITLIELAHGKPPLARMNPMRVLMDTMHKPAPHLDDQPEGTQFSKALKELVDECLQKEPDLRPTATALLNHRFFRMARDPDFLHEHFLAGLTQQESPTISPVQHSSPSGCAGAAGGLASAQQGPWDSPQQHQASAWAAGNAGRAASGLQSGPSSSGPTRLASAWLFPPVVPGVRLSAHSEGHVSDSGQLAGCQAGEFGSGQGSGSATPAGADTSTAGSSTTLEQQLQPFLQQQAALRALSGFGAGLGAGPAGLRMGSTLAYSAGLSGPMLEAHLEVEGAEEEGVSSHSNAVADSNIQATAVAAAEHQATAAQGAADQDAATGAGAEEGRTSAVAAQEPSFTQCSGSAPWRPAVATTQPHGSANAEAQAVDTCAQPCAAAQGACHSCSACHSAPGCNSACSSQLATVASGSLHAALTQDCIETMLATPTPATAPQQVDEMWMLPTGVVDECACASGCAAAAATVQASAPAPDAVVRIVKPGSQQEDYKQKAPGLACSHAKSPTSPCQSPSFKDTFSWFGRLKGRVLSPKSSAGKAAMSAAAAAACAASPASAS